MRFDRLKSRLTRPTPARFGGVRRRLVIVIVLLCVCVAAGWGVVYAFRGDSNAQVITRRPLVGEFAVDIIERGDVESSMNTELRCEIASADGVRILEIIAEGTLVKPGDTVVQLDDSTIQKDLNAQRIAVNTAEAAKSKAENELEAEQIALKEYQEGTFVQDKQKLESEMFVAEENFRRAENYYKHSRILAARGYITETQLDGDQFSVEKFKKDLGAAQTKLRVIEQYTLKKTVRKHESTINTAKAAVMAETAKLKIEEEKLKNLEDQLAKCVIKATTTGQVVYNNPNRWASEEYFIRKGNRVRERQVIAKLPDVSKMQIKAKIGEARVDRVKPEMAAIIRVEAMRGVELKGKVKSVSAYASDENWFNPNTKEYDAVIIVNDPPPTLKPGMTSQVEIRVETLPNVLQVPVQCVREQTGKHYSVVRLPDGKLELREVTVGSTNEKFIVIKDGIRETDDVVMNPKPHFAKLGLKDVESAAEQAKSDDKNAKKSEAPASGKGTT